MSISVIAIETRLLARWPGEVVELIALPLPLPLAPLAALALDLDLTKSTERRFSAPTCLNAFPGLAGAEMSRRRRWEEEEDERGVEERLRSMEVVDLFELELLFELLIELVTERGLLITLRTEESERSLGCRWSSCSSLSVSEPDA
jgi:hypothetical protein